MNKELRDNDLNNYVNIIMKTETSCYSQEKALAEAKMRYNDVKNKPPQQASLGNAPILETVSIPEKPLEPIKPQFGEGYKVMWFPIILGPISILLSVALFSLGVTFFGVIMVVVSLVCIGALIGYLVQAKKDYEAKMAKYESAKSEYPKLLKLYEDEMKLLPSKREEAKAKLVEQSAKYAEKVRLNNEAYKTECSNYRQSLNDTECAIGEMTAVLDETRDVLEKLYELDIVFPKYRNLVAITTIAEYLASGRCSELTGPNGAYNLYESELRQNRIIASLDAVVSQLEQVKENQYLLFTEIKKANEISTYIAMETNKIANSVSHIEANSAITAYCSKITAANSEVLNYIALLK